ncbi:MAG: TadE family protein [Thermoguttaceae bacterium]
MVEFAVVCLVVYMLLAAILTFGQLFYSAQTLQQAADVAAREISRTPLLATANLMDVLYSSNPSDYSNGPSTVRTALFDPQYLQFDLTAGVPAGQSVLNVVQTWPIINQMLYPAMIVQPGHQVYGGNAEHEYLWYPGAVPCTDSANPNRTVYCVARVDGRQPDGAETITWVPVIEEITPGAFSVASTQGGLVSLRINYGYQSATMSAFPPPEAWPPEPNGPAWGARDSEVTVNSSNYTPITGTAPWHDVSPYSGPYGLGKQAAWAGWQRTDPVPPPPSQWPPAVRPYRSLISAQAIYRREVFQ